MRPHVLVVAAYAQETENAEAETWAFASYKGSEWPVTFPLKFLLKSINFK